MSRKYNMRGLIIILIAAFAVAMAGVFLSVKEDE